MNKLHKKLEKLTRFQKTHIETTSDGDTELSIWTDSTKLENEIVKLLDANNIHYIKNTEKGGCFFNLILEDLYR